jgi:hypothetical protein
MLFAYSSRSSVSNPPPLFPGEVGELRTELANPDVDIMKDAVKKVRPPH